MIVPHVNPQVNIQIKKTSSVDEKPFLSFTSKDIREIVDYAWDKNNTEVAYDPNYPSLTKFINLKKDERKALESYLALARDFAEEGYTRETLNSAFQNPENSRLVLAGFESCVQEYLCLMDDEKKVKQRKRVLAQELHNMFINMGWLEKYWMFADLKTTGRAESFIPKEISKPYLLLANLFGNHPEFTYYTHYVGASIGNMSECQAALDKVLFNDPESMVNWVNMFKPLYSFQPKKNAEAFQAEKYFRFIHLAMEMVFSRDIELLRDQLGKALDTTDRDGAQAHLSDALAILYKLELHQNAVFKTLKLGSDPKLYNGDVRPFIAGTWGKNCGSVFLEKGKFFEDCCIPNWNDATNFKLEDFSSPMGIWKKHVGQTGAGTSVRPICDEFAGGVSKLYDSELSIELVEALMTDDKEKVQKISDTMNPLSFMLTSFRAISRPYSHNKQIIDAKSQISTLLPVISSHPKLLAKLLQCQTMALVHRLDHYHYVNAYINAHPAKTAQMRSVATGGSQTTGFLPDLIRSNIIKARDYLERYRVSIEEVSATDSALAKELREDYNLFEASLLRFDDHCKVLSKKCEEIEVEDDSKDQKMHG